MPSAAAQREIDDLDYTLARDGEDIVLRRVVGTGSQINIDVKCRAIVRTEKVSEIVSGITQRTSTAILSPTEITRAQWPGGQPASSAIRQIDPRLPRIGDKVIAGGEPLNIEVVKPVLVDGDLIRINLEMLG